MCLQNTERGYLIPIYFPKEFALTYGLDCLLLTNLTFFKEKSWLVVAEQSEAT